LREKFAHIQPEGQVEPLFSLNDFLDISSTSPFRLKVETEHLSYLARGAGYSLQTSGCPIKQAEGSSFQAKAFSLKHPLSLKHSG